MRASGIFITFVIFIIALSGNSALAKIDRNDVENAWEKISKADSFPKSPIEYEEDGSPNAWVTFESDNNYSVHVTLSLMEVLDNEAEIAGILGHEIGHVRLGHYNREVLTDIGQSLLEIRKDKIDNIAQAIGAVDIDLNKSLFSREQETEADDYGVKTLAKAGYDVWALYKAMEHFKTDDEKSSGFDSHPSNAARLAHLSDEAKRYENKKGIIVDKDRIAYEDSAPVASEFTKWQKQSSQIKTSLKQDDENEMHGYTPSPVDMSHLTRNPPKNITKRALSANIPEKYDMRNTGLLTPVRDQNPYGTCWTHASMIACESNYLIRSKKGLIKNDLGSYKNLNFSEMYLAWFAYFNPEKNKAFTTIDNRGNLTNAANLNMAQILNQGGNEFKSAAILSRTGIILENKMPYAKTPSRNLKPENFQAVLRLKEMTFAAPSVSSSEQMKITKQLIMDRGAVLISYCEDDNYHDNKNHTYFKKGQASVNHMVAIVGWDDNYPRKNFGRDKPQHNGAWLIRNSWGTNWAAGGYFWMSYEQNYNTGSAFTVEPARSDMTVYCYDDLGWDTSINVNGQKTCYAANVFEVKSAHEILNEVSFYTTDNGAKYEISIYTYNSKPAAASLTKSKPVATKRGTMDLAGYHVVKIDDVNLKAGNYFAVVIKMSTPSFSYPLAVEQYFKNYTDNFMIHAGESYFSSDGSNWFDGIKFKINNRITPVNACIKAFTIKNSAGTVDDDDEDENYNDDDYDDEEAEEIIKPVINIKTFVANLIPEIKKGAAWCSGQAVENEEPENSLSGLVSKLAPEILKGAEWVKIGSSQDEDENYNEEPDEEYDDEDFNEDDYDIGIILIPKRK